MNLPNSHVIVVIATQFNRFADGTFREKVGFAPDVPVPPGTDAFTVALGWIARGDSTP